MNNDIFTGLLPNDTQYIKKCDEYMAYIEDHKTRVITAYHKYFKDRIFNILSSFMKDISVKECDIYEKMLLDSVQNHDLSKYSDMEFGPYRLKFYPTDYEKEIMKDDEEKDALAKEMFEDAWHHHYTNNKHHPQFFIWNKITDEGFKLLDQPLEVPQDMDIISIMEMICDWSAMSKGDNDYNYLYWWLNADMSADEHKYMSYKTKTIVKLISLQLFPDECKDIDDSIWFMDNDTKDIKEE